MNQEIFYTKSGRVGSNLILGGDNGSVVKGLLVATASATASVVISHGDLVEKFIYTLFEITQNTIRVNGNLNGIIFAGDIVEIETKGGSKLTFNILSITATTQVTTFTVSSGGVGGITHFNNIDLYTTTVNVYKYQSITIFNSEVSGNTDIINLLKSNYFKLEPLGLISVTSTATISIFLEDY
jgi:hypothetical protein